MAEIAEDGTFTQVVRFGIEPGREEALVEVIAAEVERWVRHRPGFVSASFHVAREGGGVLNYAQWRDRASFEGFLADPEGGALKAAIAAVDPREGPEGTAYCVVRSIAAPNRASA